MGEPRRGIRGAGRNPDLTRLQPVDAVDHTQLVWPKTGQLTLHGKGDLRGVPGNRGRNKRVAIPRLFRDIAAIGGDEF